MIKNFDPATSLHPRWRRDRLEGECERHRCLCHKCSVPSRRFKLLSFCFKSEHLKGCSDFVSEFVALFDPLKTFFATPTPDQSNFLAEFDRSNNSSCRCTLINTYQPLFNVAVEVTDSLVVFGNLMSTTATWWLAGTRWQLYKASTVYKGWWEGVRKLRTLTIVFVEFGVQHETLYLYPP